MSNEQAERGDSPSPSNQPGAPAGAGADEAVNGVEGPGGLRPTPQTEPARSEEGSPPPDPGAADPPASADTHGAKQEDEERAEPWRVPIQYNDDPADPEDVDPKHAEDPGRAHVEKFGASLRTAPGTRHPRSGKPTTNYVAFIDLAGKAARFDLDRLDLDPPGTDAWYGRGVSAGGRGTDEMLCRVRPGRWVLVYLTLAEGDEDLLTLAEIDAVPWGEGGAGAPVDRELTPQQAAEWLERNGDVLPADLEPAPPFDLRQPGSGRLDREWQPEATAGDQAEGAAHTPGEPGRAPKVVLNGEAGPPTIGGKDQDRLTTEQYRVVRALLDAGPRGLSGGELVTESGHSDAVNILKRLSAKGDWASVIALAEKKGGRYRILS